MDTMSNVEVAEWPGRHARAHSLQQQSELIQAKLQGLGLWLPTPAQLGVECDWPEPGVVAKNILVFFQQDNPTAFYFFS